MGLPWVCHGHEDAWGHAKELTFLEDPDLLMTMVLVLHTRAE
ncbi:MAG: hypothetical protein WCR02_08875 [Sphaerochaetaceae bacterium]